jgi:hypothetical protein
VPRPPLVFLFRSDVSVELLLASMFVAIMANAVDVGQEFERAKLRPYRFAAISIVRSVSSVGFGLLGIWLGWGGMGLLAAFGLGSLTGIILNLVGDRTRIAGFQRSQFMQLARYGLPLTLAGLSVALYSTCDRLIVAYLLGRDAAGIFGVAADLPRQFMVMIASSVAAATVPLVFRSLAEKNNETTRERLTESLELLLVVVAPVAIWLALAAGSGRRHAGRRRFPRRRVGAAADPGARPLLRHRQSVLRPDQFSARRAALHAGGAVVPHAGGERRLDVRTGRRLRPQRRRAGDACDRRRSASSSRSR